MDRHGGQAVYLARFLPVVRTLTLHLAGSTRLPYARIAPCSALAALLWAGAEAGIGYAALATAGRGSDRSVWTVGPPSGRERSCASP